MPPAQMVTPLVLHAMKYFDAAARHRSFTRAAEELHVTQGAVSQQIKGLEEQLGLRLFSRLPRGLALTQEGERLYRVVHKALRELEAELHALRPGVARRTLVLRSSPSFSMMWLMPRLNQFSRQYPEVEIRLRGELFGMSSARMHAESVDALVLYGERPERGTPLVTDLLSEFLLPVINPDYAARHPPLTQAADFAEHTLLHDDAPWEGAPAFAEWEEWLGAVARHRGAVPAGVGRRGHQYNLAHLTINAAQLGQGVAMARSSLVCEELARGQLLPALPFRSLSPARYWLVLNPDTVNQTAMQVFRDWIVNECQQFEREREALLAPVAAIV